MSSMSEPAYPVSPESTEAWHDKKRRLWLLGLIVPSLAFVSAGMHGLTGWSVWFWIGPIVVLVLVPVIDLVAGRDGSNPPDELIEALENDRYYRWIVFAYLPVQYAGLLLSMWLIAGGDLSRADKVGLAVTVGFIGGIGINAAHELGHKKESHERWLSKIALAQSCYGHFYIEHNRGHHVRVATPDDPASARLGENFYQFWPRTVGGSLRSAWRLEKRRIARRGNRHPFRIGNDVLNAWLMSVVLWSGLIAWLGWLVLPYLLLQALIGVTLLEAVNYIEHYGMSRRRVGAPGRERYERVDPTHSWNSNNIATNVLLYHLQRHSDHHAYPTRRYQVLRDYRESPVLPTGYAGMILLALVPPLWRRTMDRRVLTHFDGDLRRANLMPRKRDRLLTAYPPAPVEYAGTHAGDRRPGTAGDFAAARCPNCGYTYRVTAGDEREGFSAGTPWSEIPDDWCCPDCGVREKVDFVAPV
ncbi:MAG: fatty acid desaturase [Nocardioides sp.]